MPAAAAEVGCLCVRLGAAVAGFRERQRAKNLRAVRESYRGSFSTEGDLALQKPERAHLY